MNLQMLTQFFLWCTILNGILLLLWSGAFIFVPDLVYRTQKRWLPISRESFDLIFYGFLGFFKIVFLVFNVVPLLALLIIG
ncbi:MAG: hypothetical protein KA031_03695 [Candidatus Hydrogenedentes bacterium]|jgi:hypothetical protein|nr:hypothetical protein [Candidatus Hydrogenedentota bacterium]OQB28561.1 MAG: hypothetical protein BWY09_03140 [Candidatus Hydrogenedentes bacterium ADurb.Bin179]